jgi:transposase
MFTLRIKDRWAIVTFKRYNFTNNYIIKTVGVSNNTINLWWNRFCETADVKDDNTNRGRKRKTTTEQDKQIQEIVRSDQKQGSRQVAQKLRPNSPWIFLLEPQQEESKKWVVNLSTLTSNLH